MRILHCQTVFGGLSKCTARTYGKVASRHKDIRDLHFIVPFMSNQEVPQEKRIAQRIVKELDRLLPGPPIVGVTPIAELPKTSAVILNWSRFSNVLIIVASLSTIEGIDEILIWNNNPQKLSHEEGAS